MFDIEDYKKLMICNYCGAEVELIDSKDYYSNGKSYGLMYLCRPCDAYVGVHKGTTKALGTLANKELRELRKQCHKLIDPLWQSGELKRKEVYKMLGEQLNIPKDNMHVAMFDIEDCKKLIRSFDKLKNERQKPNDYPK